MRIEELRRHRWAAAWRLLPVILGVFQLLVVTLVSLSAGFASTAAFAVITVADMLIAGIGVALMRESAASESPAPAQSVQV